MLCACTAQFIVQYQFFKKNLFNYFLCKKVLIQIIIVGILLYYLWRDDRQSGCGFYISRGRGGASTCRNPASCNDAEPRPMHQNGVVSGSPLSLPLSILIFIIIISVVTRTTRGWIALFVVQAGQDWRHIVGHWQISRLMMENQKRLK